MAGCEWGGVRERRRENGRKRGDKAKKRERKVS